MPLPQISLLQLLLERFPPRTARRFEVGLLRGTLPIPTHLYLRGEQARGSPTLIRPPSLELLVAAAAIYIDACTAPLLPESVDGSVILQFTPSFHHTSPARILVPLG